jgi:hypothetical protein
VDDAGDRLQLFVNAAPRESVALSQLFQGGTIAGNNPTVLNDVNNWLGRSQFSNDSELGGAILEFRIYRAALSQAELSFSFSQGPDATFLQP